MTAELLWNNLSTYFLQILALIAAGGVLPRLFRLRLHSARLIYWQALLALCLLLPFVQPWQVQEAIPSSERAVAPAVAGPLLPGADSHVEWIPVILGVVAAGIAGRFLWLGFGLLQLRKLRLTARPWEEAPVWVSETMGRVPAAAQISISDRVSGPVTFGIRDAVILLPRNFTQLETAHQRSILAHELLHVRRRDWGFTIAEEVALAILWFHPAVWWLAGQIRLSREQAVDFQATALEDRQHYVGAMLAVANAGGGLDLAPAQLFLRRRHLLRRVEAIFQEVSMSRHHLVLSFVSAAAVVAITVFTAVRALPLQAAPQTQTNSPAGQTGYLRDILFSDDLPEATRAELRKETAPFVGALFDDDLVQRIRQTVLKPGRPIALTWSTADNGDRIVTTTTGGLEAPPPLAESFPKKDGVTQIRVGGDVQSAKVISNKRPVYPLEAKVARIQGTVRFNVLIAREGHVELLQLVSGHPLLVPSALEAVRQWTYRPTLLNGVPVEVVTVVDVNYTLSK